MITAVHMGAPRDGYSFFADGQLHEVALGSWDSLVIEWWLASRDWRWAEA